MSAQPKCQVCGFYKTNHNMLHPFIEHPIQRRVCPKELTHDLLPQQDYLLVGANPCQVCGLLPQNHNCHHSYQPKFQPAGLPAQGHQKYSPQKEYQGVVSESYYKGYELLMESQDQVPVEDPTRRTTQNLKEHFPGHPHDYPRGFPGSWQPQNNVPLVPGYSLNPHHSSVF